MKSSQSTVFETSTNRIATRITGRPGFIFPARCLLALLVLFGVILPATQVQSAIIQQPIAIDGVMSDWKLPADITTNPGQNSLDGDGSVDTSIPADLDYEVRATDSDLKGFSFTYDDTNLYMWIERYVSSNSTTDWWFYLDTDNNGSMESTDKLLRVVWFGNTGKTNVQLYNYVEAEPGGDPLVCPESTTTELYSRTGGWCPVANVADGYDMPGTKGTEISLSLPDVPDQNGGCISGLCTGLEMEAKISWDALGFGGPSSVGFHIASSTGGNIPNQIEDNVNGFGGGIGIIDLSPDIIVVKFAQTIDDPVSSANPKSIPGANVLYTITISNQGPGVADADSVIITDPVPTNTELYVGAGSPVVFIDGTTSSGLSLNFTSLGSSTDDIEFSTAIGGGGPYTYTPIDVGGYDSNVTDMRLMPKGTFAASDGTNHPSFTIRFQVRLQ